MAETIDQLVEVPVEIIDGQEEGVQAYNMNTQTANYTARRVHYVTSRYWRGLPASDNPALPPGYYAIPKQIGPFPEGVKFGLVYADGSDRTDRQFVVAFDSPAGKAYAESGPVAAVNWDLIELKLSMCGNKTDFTDPYLGGRCMAEMAANGDGFAYFRG